MDITPNQLLDEAAHMALELRLKDRAIAALEADNERLRAQAQELGAEVPAEGEAPQEPQARGHSHRH